METYQIAAVVFVLFGLLLIACYNPKRKAEIIGYGRETFTVRFNDGKVMSFFPNANIDALRHEFPVGSRVMIKTESERSKYADVFHPEAKAT